jgi:adenylosuccinate synthase
MPSVVIVGTQWGDEGKGKIVDYCASEAKLVVRYQGGANAGHTIVTDSMELKLQLIPSGVIQGKKVLIGAGVVIDPRTLVEEIKNVESLGIRLNLVVSGKAHITLPYHNLLDQSWEHTRNKKKIGTTGRGIGPTYSDKMKRIGLRMAEFTGAGFEDRIQLNTSISNKILEHILNDNRLLQYEDIIREYTDLSTQLREYVGDVSRLVNDALDENQNVLFEGAQATMLDIDHGTYPYVTSSNPTAGGACTGVGVGPTKIDQVLGVCKAYTTRVGAGPFPSELHDHEGDRLREAGGEYGTVTGRPRRCGWLDLNIIRYARRINGLTGLALTKMDVLNGMEQVKVCVSYNWNGSEIQDVPFHTLEKCEPTYVELEGWEFLFLENNLSQTAKAYVDMIEQEVGIPVYYVSTGPRRSDTICLQNVWS